MLILFVAASVASAVEAPPPPAVHCDPSAKPPQKCPGGLACPPTGLCPSPGPPPPPPTPPPSPSPPATDAPSCQASGGGWTGFGSTGPGSCGKGEKTNMDDGTGPSIHVCECSTTGTAPWSKQIRGHAANAMDCKNHICLDALYTACRFDGSVIITGKWFGKTLNVTGADPDLCPAAAKLPIPPPWYHWSNGSSPSCNSTCGRPASISAGTVVCTKETDLSSVTVADSFCAGNGTKPPALTQQCPATQPCVPGPYCFVSGGGWTGFDADGPGGCGTGSSKSNMDDGGSKVNHTCQCQTKAGAPWVNQTRGHAASSAGNCKNHICLTSLYSACRYDGALIIEGMWDPPGSPGPRLLNVTAADPKVCPKAPPLPPAPPLAPPVAH